MLPEAEECITIGGHIHTKRLHSQAWHVSATKGVATGLPQGFGTVGQKQESRFVDARGGVRERIRGVPVCPAEMQTAYSAIYHWTVLLSSFRW
jgi:hypothetical protein